MCEIATESAPKESVETDNCEEKSAFVVLSPQMKAMQCCCRNGRGSMKRSWDAARGDRGRTVHLVERNPRAKGARSSRVEEEKIRELDQNGGDWFKRGCGREKA